MGTFFCSRLRLHLQTSDESETRLSSSARHHPATTCCKSSELPSALVRRQCGPGGRSSLFRQASTSETRQTVGKSALKQNRVLGGCIQRCGTFHVDPRRGPQTPRSRDSADPRQRSRAGRTSSHRWKSLDPQAEAQAQQLQ